VVSYGQGSRSISINDVAGVSKNGNSYVVDCDVDLKGKTLTIPQSSKVVFKGGRIANGTVLFDKAQLEGDVCIDSDIQGTITNNEIKATWFGLQSGSKSKQTKKLQSIIDLFKSNVSSNSWEINPKNPEPTIIIPAGEYNVIGDVELRSYVTIKGAGRGSTILRGVTFKATKQYNITIEDLSLVGYVAATKNGSYNIDNTSHSSAFKLNDCARLIFKNVCIKNYDVAFDNYNTCLVDLYSCFVSSCNVCYMNDGKGHGYGGHAIRWYGGEMSDSKYGFVQKNGSGVLLNGATLEACKYGVNLIYPTSFSINSCYFEGNNYDIYGTIVHVNIENNYFTEYGKDDDGAYIYATPSIGFAVIQGNKFGETLPNAPHIMLEEKAVVYGNILIGQNDIIHGSRIPVSERLLPFISEKGSNVYQTYLPDAEKMLMGQTVVYKNPNTGEYYLITRSEEGELLFSPFYTKTNIEHKK
jgi:hypothetical protein